MQSTKTAPAERSFANSRFVLLQKQEAGNRETVDDEQRGKDAVGGEEHRAVARNSYFPSVLPASEHLPKQLVHALSVLLWISSTPEASTTCPFRMKTTLSKMRLDVPDQVRGEQNRRAALVVLRIVFSM